jgi:hypothetical protein
MFAKQMAKNKYVQGAGRYVLAAGALSLGYLVLEKTKKVISKKHSSFVSSRLNVALTPQQRDTLEADPEYADILFRLLEFRELGPEGFQDLVNAIVNVVKFVNELDGRIVQSTVKTYAKHGNVVIDCVRRMRAYMELKFPDAVDDFDEIAADIQSKYDETHERLLFEAQLLKY